MGAERRPCREGVCPPARGGPGSGGSVKPPRCPPKMPRQAPVEAEAVGMLSVRHNELRDQALRCVTWGWGRRTGQLHEGERWGGTDQESKGGGGASLWENRSFPQSRGLRVLGGFKVTNLAAEQGFLPEAMKGGRKGECVGEEWTLGPFLSQGQPTRRAQHPEWQLGLWRNSCPAPPWILGGSPGSPGSLACFSLHTGAGQPLPAEGEDRRHRLSTVLVN